MNLNHQLALASIQFSVEELRTLHDEFLAFDINQDGKLEPYEIQQILENATGEKVHLREIEYVISYVDHNNDKALEFNEFIDMVKYVRLIDNEAYEQFRFFDANNDGFIDYQELKRGLVCLNQRLARTHIKRMIEEADVDRDGRVSFEEFKHVLLMSST